MPRTKLTTRAVDQLSAPDPSGKQQLFWDTELRGFGVLVSGKTNAKTFVVQRDIAGKTRRVTIGPTNVLSLDEARRRAEGVLANFFLGIDPKARHGGDETLRGALADYLAARKDLADRSREAYCDSVERHLTDWLDRPLKEITAEMVEDRHRSIAAGVARAGLYSGHASANAAMRVLRTLYNFAAKRNPALPANPVRRLKRQWFPVPRRERMVRADELPAFYRAVVALPNPIGRDLITLMLFTGLRKSEAASLT